MKKLLQNPRAQHLGASLSIVSVMSCAIAVNAGDEPTIGPQIRIDTNGGDEASNETSATANPLNDLEIIGTWNDWRFSTNQEVIRMGVGISVDGGLTWDDFTVRPPAPNQSGVEGDPMTAFDPETGTTWVGAISFAGNGGLYVARKNPGDNFFQPSVMADVGAGIDKCWMTYGPVPFSADRRLYIAYNFGLIWSDDMGQTWNNPVSQGSGLGFNPKLGPSGQIYIAYWDFGSQDFRLRRSLNGGGSFSDHQIADRMDTWGTETFNSRFPGTMRVPPLPALAVDPNDGTLYAAFPDTTGFDGGNANVDIYFSKSVDQGTTWTTPVVVNGDFPFVGDQFFPWLEVDNEGRIHMVFLDSRNTQQNDNVTNGMLDAYYSWSDDGGATFNEHRLTPQSFNSDNDGLNRSSQFLGDYLGLAMSENAVWPVYLDTTNGDTDIYTHKITFEAPCPADIEGDDGEVGVDDLLLLLANWGNLGPGSDLAQPNVVIDVNDLLVLLAEWGPCD